jgi:polysaccharide export outer membrane protein
MVEFKRGIGAGLMSVAALGMLPACSTVDPTVKTGAEAYLIAPPPSAGNNQRDYQIGPLDTISINVFQEPELTLQNVQVDASGNILLPLIGIVVAAGKTSGELSRDVASKLSERYLVNPQVSVIVVSSVSQKVTVDGSVTQSGVYAIQGRTTLLDALAMARGTTRVAALDQVLVFRDVNGESKVARFNVADIRSGKQPNPEVVGNDIIVVGFSAFKGAYRDFLSTAPLIAAFANISRQ